MGVGFTFTVKVCPSLHPFVVPVTVYMVVEEGNTVIELVVAPLLHI